MSVEPTMKQVVPSTSSKTVITKPTAGADLSGQCLQTSAHRDLYPPARETVTTGPSIGILQKFANPSGSSSTHSRDSPHLRRPSSQAKTKVANRSALTNCAVLTTRKHFPKAVLQGCEPQVLFNNRIRCLKAMGWLPLAYTDSAVITVKVLQRREAFLCCIEHSTKPAQRQTEGSTDGQT
ncbi:uncharacterized protein LOC119161443 isoform X2 [Rhipicephalus microplus]|uniref:uncharacterized protein LOC119161443 isoform X2 n=1 Tax=Rhipicephalus microplus TaxID=6941 RepID=UPI003F6C9421